MMGIQVVNKWDYRALRLARTVATWSKDPNTQVGACIMRPDRTVASVGFNGFPRGVQDNARLDDREQKYDLIIHAEMNAILHAREPLGGYTIAIYPLLPCVRCAVHVIQAGIKFVVAPPITTETEHWRASVEKSVELFREAGVQVTLIDP
jgi:dCMP deaminase